jgi:hypothetical protein
MLVMRESVAYGSGRHDDVWRVSDAAEVAAAIIHDHYAELAASRQLVRDDVVPRRLALRVAMVSVVVTSAVSPLTTNLVAAFAISIALFAAIDAALKYVSRRTW